MADHRPAGRSVEAFDSVFALAEVVYLSGAYDSARVILSGIRERAAESGETAAEARALTWVGLVEWRVGDFDQATLLGREAVQLKLRHQLDDQLARSYNALGLVAWTQTRLTESLEWYHLADSVSRALGDERTAFVVAANVANSMIELGQFAEARQSLQDVRAFMASVDDARLEGNALINLGMLETRLGDPVAGLESLREAIRRHESVGYQTGVANALGHVGGAYVALGQPSAALASLDSALVLAREQGLRAEEARFLEIMAEVYRGAGDYPRAITLYDRAQVINARLGLNWETGIDLRGEADIHARLGAYQRARELAAEALSIHRNVGAPLEEMRDLLMLAEVSDLSDDPPAVDTLMSLAAGIATGLAAPIARVEVALTHGRIHDRHRRSEEVLSTLGAISDDLSLGGYNTEWEAAHLRSRAYLRTGRLESATISARRAVAAVERVRSRFGSTVLRTAFAADKRAVYAHLVSVLMRVGEVEEAFEVADGARGRALLEHSPSRLDRALGGWTRPDGEELLRQLDAIEERIAFFEDVPPLDRTGAEQTELDGLYARLRRDRSRYDLLLVQAAESDPTRSAFLGRSRTDADRVRRTLRPEQLLLEYFVPDQGPVRVFLVSRQGIRALEVPVDPANLSSRVRLARELIARRDSDGLLSQVLQGLHGVLVRPAVAAGLLADASELVIVPHDVLSYLPFSALLDPTTGRYLVEDFDLRVLPSAAALPLLTERNPRRSVAGAAMFAPFPDALPASRDETSTVGSILGATRRVGRTATEAAVADALTGSRIVHIATHAELNRVNPIFSRVELAAGSGDPGDDGRLEVHEVMALNIRSELVFLSGCETSLGLAGSTTFAPGEDFATLSQSFLLAGAGNVVGTLWPVEDRAAAEMAGRFYAALSRGDAARALATAQRELLSEPPYRAPYHWAAYQLAGGGEVSIP